MTTPQDSFGQLLQMVVGEAFTAAGYKLQNNPTHQSRGLFRFQKALDDDISAYIEFQLLYYPGGGPSRFRVNLLRNRGPDARITSNDDKRVEIALTKLLWEDFDVQQLSGPDHWWLFNNSYDLGHAIAEAGKLIIGFGMPWVEGTLKPDQTSDQVDQM